MILLKTVLVCLLAYTIAASIALAWFTSRYHNKVWFIFSLSAMAATFALIALMI